MTLYRKTEESLKKILSPSQYTRYVDLLERKDSYNVKWNEIHPISDISDFYTAVTEAPTEQIDALMKKVAIVKLNGGYDIGSDLQVPLAIQIVKNNENFLQIIFKQVKYLNEKYNAKIPLIFMNSSSTESETLKFTNAVEGLEVINFSQTAYPRLGKDSLQPLAKKANDAEYCFYPAGHGTVFEDLKSSGILEKLLSRGIEHIFISNMDNLGATLDANLLYHFASQKKKVQVEVTPKKYVDVIGGTFITAPKKDNKDAFALLEVAQVPPEHLDDFKSNLRFRVFNTNNIYVSLPWLDGLLSKGPLQLDVIPNYATVNNQQALQLSILAGGIVSLAPREDVEFVNVPRVRFLPVKSCSDLFLIQSDYFKIENGFLVVNKSKSVAFQGPGSGSGSGSSDAATAVAKPSFAPFEAPLPSISLGPFFVKLADYYARIPSLPEIQDLHSLTIAGDVYFQKGVVLRGQVVIVAREGERMWIPSGSVLENCVVQGALELVPRS